MVLYSKQNITFNISIPFSFGSYRSSLFNSIQFDLIRYQLCFFSSPILSYPDHCYIYGYTIITGLYVWLRDGTRVLVRVPDGCLLIQAGKQMEWLTGGAVTAGFHEVVVTPETLQAIEKAQAEHRSLWRVSSTLFSHIASDKELRPLAHFGNNQDAVKNYPPILAGHQVEEELRLIQLASPTNK